MSEAGVGETERDTPAGVSPAVFASRLRLFLEGKEACQNGRPCVVVIRSCFFTWRPAGPRVLS